MPSIPLADWESALRAELHDADTSARVVDDSFGHAFGTERVYSVEATGSGTVLLTLDVGDLLRGPTLSYRDMIDGGACREGAYSALRSFRRRSGRKVAVDEQVPLLEILDVMGLELALDAAIHAQLDTPVLRLFACDCAERALTRERDAGREPDPRSWAAVEIARRYARGEATDDELAAAWIAAWAAARTAAWAAARTAAKTAAWAAARTAAMAAAWAAAGAAAGAAERDWQATHLRELLLADALSTISDELDSLTTTREAGGCDGEHRGRCRPSCEPIEYEVAATFQGVERLDERTVAATWTWEAGR